MRSIKVLEMINNGRIEELKDLLRDEIYAEALKKKPGAAKRYSAMKKFFTYVNTARTACLKPAMVEYEGKTVTSFCNAYSLALTSEPCGGIELFTEADGNYPNTTRLVKREGDPKRVNLAKVLAEAKALGYKLKKSEVNGTGSHFMMRYDGRYFRLGLVDSTFAIIDDGEHPYLYSGETVYSPITIENDIGVCLVSPVRCGEEFIKENNITVIDLEEV